MTVKLKFYILISLVVLTSSCSENIEEMDGWETQLAAELEATNVQFSHMSTSTTTNGNLTESKVFLQLNIVNSNILDKIDHNERVLTWKCDEIRDKVLTLVEALPSKFSYFNELKIKLIQKKGVFMFKTETVKTVTYRIH